MIRIICVENEHTASVHVGGPPMIAYKTFDLECPELESWLFGYRGTSGHGYNQRSICGCEVVQTEPRRSERR